MANVAIYGSCVSRDALSLVSTHDYSLAAYFARSSLASSCAPASDALWALAAKKLENIDSDFQRRMVAADIEKTAVSALAELDWDALVVDLIDERFSLFDTEAGVCTVSNEFLRTGLKPKPEELTKPGSDRHWDLWRTGADRFCRALEGRTIVLNEAYWAMGTVEGKSLEPKFPVNANNELLGRMYEEFRARLPQCAVIDYPGSLLVADPGHRWGLSPFHFVQAFYDHTIGRLSGILAGDEVPASASA